MPHSNFILGGIAVTIRKRVFCATVATVGFLGSSIFCAPVAQQAAQAPQGAPTKVHQALQADLAVLADHETLVQVADFPANGGTPWHIHPDGHEIAYVMEGIWIAEADGKPTQTLKAGDSVYIPPNLVHRAYNDASGPTKIVVVRIKPKGKPVTTPFNR